MKWQQHYKQNSRGARDGKEKKRLYSSSGALLVFVNYIIGESNVVELAYKFVSLFFTRAPPTTRLCRYKGHYMSAFTLCEGDMARREGQVAS